MRAAAAVDGMKDHWVASGEQGIEMLHRPRVSPQDFRARERSRKLHPPRVLLRLTYAQLQRRDEEFGVVSSRAISILQFVSLSPVPRVRS